MNLKEQEWKDRKSYAWKRFEVILIDQDSELSNLIKNSLHYQVWRLIKAWKNLLRVIWKDLNNLFK